MKKSKKLEKKISSLKFFTGSSHAKLAQDIAQYMDIELGKIDLSIFSCGEMYARIKENVRGDNVFIMQTATENVNNDVIQLLIMIDAFMRASVRSVNVVLPHFPYSRQDKKSAPREPISARLLANLIEAAGASRIITMDLHADQIQGFFNIPVDHLFALPLFAKYFKNKKENLKEFVIVAPDTGRAKASKKFADAIGGSLAIIHKSRPRHNQAEVLNVVGEVKNKKCIIFDDMVDTAGSVCNALQALKKNGGKEFYLAATHAIFSGPAIKKLKETEFKEIVVTDTIPLNSKKFDRIKVITTAPLFAETILRNNSNASVSELMELQ